MNTNEDQQHLHLLSIFHYVVAAIAALFACFPIFHFAFGVSFLIGGITDPQEYGPMALFGLFFTVIAGTIIVLGWAFAICICVALTGCYLALKKKLYVLPGDGWGRMHLYAVWNGVWNFYDHCLDAPNG